MRSGHCQFHSVLPDGLFVPREGDETGPLEFVLLPAPSREDIGTLTERVAHGITRLVEKVSAEESDLSRLDETAAPMQRALPAQFRRRSHIQKAV